MEYNTRNTIVVFFIILYDFTLTLKLEYTLTLKLEYTLILKKFINSSVFVWYDFDP